jgi:hypothetical protein
MMLVRLDVVITGLLKDIRNLFLLHHFVRVPTGLLLYLQEGVDVVRKETICLIPKLGCLIPVIYLEVK